MDKKEIEFKETMKNVLLDLMEYYQKNNTETEYGMAVIFSTLNSLWASTIISFAKTNNLTKKETAKLVEQMIEKLFNMTKDLYAQFLALNENLELPPLDGKKDDEEPPFAPRFNFN